MVENLSIGLVRRSIHKVKEKTRYSVPIDQYRNQLEFNDVYWMSSVQLLTAISSYLVLENAKGVNSL